MQKIAPYILMVLLLGAGLFLVGRSLLFKPKALDRPLTPAQQLVAVQTSDSKILAEGHVSDDEVIKILRRYSFRGLPGTKELIQPYLHHSSVAVRAAALEAAGSLNGHPFSGEIDLALRGESAALRLAAVRALVRGPEANSLLKLRNFVKRTDLSEGERYVGMMAVYRLSNDEAERIEVVRGIVSSPPSDAAVRAEIFMDLFTMRQRDPWLIQLAQREVLHPTSGEVDRAAKAYLAASRGAVSARGRSK